MFLLTSCTVKKAITVNEIDKLEYNKRFVECIAPFKEASVKALQ